MKNIVTIIGARPQFIKASTVSPKLAQSNSVNETIVHTGQHFDDNMSKVFFRELGIPEPKYNLGINSNSHAEMTGKMLMSIEKILIDEKPDIVLVYGDTNSTLAGALSAAKLNLPVAHVEAGIRSFNKHMPEEINRVLTDHVSELAFAPTDSAVKNLKNEGFDQNKIVMVGDVMYDAAIQHGQKATLESFESNFPSLTPSEYALATIHRAENTDKPDFLESIVNALLQVAKQLPIVLPLHPRTKSKLMQYGFYSEVATELTLCEPLGYFEMLLLEKFSRLIITDSGGVQKEAYFHQKPCVTLRRETEWPELVEASWNTLVAPNNEAGIVDAVLSSTTPSEDYNFLYGEGDASNKIVEKLLNL